MSGDHFDGLEDGERLRLDVTNVRRSVIMLKL